MTGEGREEEISLDKDIIFVSKLHEILVANFDLQPLSIRLRRDPHIGFQGGDYVLLYDLGFGDELSVSCRREGGNMIVTLDSGGRRTTYSLPIDLYIDDEFMPVIDEEFERTVSEWFE